MAALGTLPVPASCTSLEHEGLVVGPVPVVAAAAVAVPARRGLDAPLPAVEGVPARLGEDGGAVDADGGGLGGVPHLGADDGAAGRHAEALVLDVAGARPRLVAPPPAPHRAHPQPARARPGHRDQVSLAALATLRCRILPMLLAYTILKWKTQKNLMPKIK